MACFKKETLILFLFLLAYQCNCDATRHKSSNQKSAKRKAYYYQKAASQETSNQTTPNKSASTQKTSSKKESSHILMRQDGTPEIDEPGEKKVTTKYTELPNGYKVSTSSEENKSYHESSHSEDGYTTSTVSENGKPPRTYTRFTYRDEIPPSPPPPPYGGKPGKPYGGAPPGGRYDNVPPGGPYGGVPHGGPYGDVPPGGPYGGVPHGGPYGGVPPGGPYGGVPPGGPYGYNAPMAPPYNGYHPPPYNLPPNYYNVPPPNDPPTGYRNGQGQEKGQTAEDYLKGIFKGYELARRMSVSGRSVPLRSGASRPRISRRPYNNRGRKDSLRTSSLLKDLLENII